MNKVAAFSPRGEKKKEKGKKRGGEMRGAPVSVARHGIAVARSGAERERKKKGKKGKENSETGKKKGKRKRDTSWSSDGTKATHRLENCLFGDSGKKKKKEEYKKGKKKKKTIPMISISHPVVSWRGGKKKKGEVERKGRGGDDALLQ